MSVVVKSYEPYSINDYWHPKSIGIYLPSLRAMLDHRKYCDQSWDRTGFGFGLWRLSICFSCQTIEQSRQNWIKMFPDGLSEEDNS